MTIVGLDDTDSRTEGMCTTYVAARLADRLRTEGDVDRLMLIRLNPAVEHKTRGNAALAVQTSVDPDRAFDLGRETLESLAISEESATNPGLVVADHRASPTTLPDESRSTERDGGDDAIQSVRNERAGSIPADVAAFTWAAVRDHHTIADAERLIDEYGYRSAHLGNGRGRIGALAAIGAQAAFEEWTYEHIAYRERDRWGTPRTVDAESVFGAADGASPDVWDTVDREAGELVCVPHTPGPVLFGIRGDRSAAVDRVASQIEGEPIERRARFLTNQGTDVHLRDARFGGGETLENGRAYRIDGVVDGEPKTRRGGHVFVPLLAPDGTDRIDCVAFEPTKRFRDRVRALRPGDRLTACGELARGTLKLEKFAVRELVRTDRRTPRCPSCDRTMESAGRNQGYRCRDCETSTDGRERVTIERSLAVGWYEVPPRARRHVAKPLVRGGFDAPVHPER
ncbi:tRNA(Ile)(2)-agmatinylcytidine synthase [Halovivax gelatinilyticus]|uniref:tRNA(Ile)(2)-agmatinylcytidine synthase n=1 Tax=Halovivax gelatinilyticus TaxID=2961597 RepID=UPI0020CA3F92|nr:tRNA(Ile)(2)-agmatinylcytidine synthase [Halovivax gelatinilyticus]